MADKALKNKNGLVTGVAGVPFVVWSPITNRVATLRLCWTRVAVRVVGTGIATATGCGNPTGHWR